MIPLAVFQENMVHLCQKLRLSRAFLSAEISRFHKRSFSQKSSKRHQVYVSTSDDIYTNLALEEWLYEKEDFNQKSILLMWQNKPAVVIGRHQNPWLECNVPKLREHGIDLARRISGGGCVYHDLGNLNCSFLKTKKQYNRRQNLDLVVEAVTNQWGVDLQVNTREDIVLDGLYKVGSHIQVYIYINYVSFQLTVLCFPNIKFPLFPFLH